MSRRARLNYIRAVSQQVNHKKMYKAKKQWVVAGISFLVATGLPAIGNSLNVHADTAQNGNQRQTTQLRPSQQSIQNKANILHSYIVNNQPKATQTKVQSVANQSNNQLNSINNTKQQNNNPAVKNNTNVNANSNNIQNNNKNIQQSNSNDFQLNTNTQSATSASVSQSEPRINRVQKHNNSFNLQNNKVNHSLRQVGQINHLFNNAKARTYINYNKTNYNVYNNGVKTATPKQSNTNSLSSNNLGQQNQSASQVKTNQSANNNTSSSKNSIANPIKSDNVNKNKSYSNSISSANNKVISANQVTISNSDKSNTSKNNFQALNKTTPNTPLVGIKQRATLRVTYKDGPYKVASDFYNGYKGDSYKSNIDSELVPSDQVRGNKLSKNTYYLLNTDSDKGTFQRMGQQKVVQLGNYANLQITYTDEGKHEATVTKSSDGTPIQIKGVAGKPIDITSDIINNTPNDLNPAGGNIYVNGQLVNDNYSASNTYGDQYTITMPSPSPTASFGLSWLPLDSDGYTEMPQNTNSDSFLGTGYQDYGNGKYHIYYSPTTKNAIVTGDFSNYTGGSILNGTEADNAKEVDLGRVTGLKTMTGMFQSDKNLQAIKQVGDWDTSSVSDMSYTFENDTSLNDISGITNFNTSNVTNMQSDFQSDRALTNVNALSEWNVSNVTNMTNDFRNMGALTDASGLRNWNVTNVINMSYTFSSDSNLSQISDLAYWNTQNVSSMINMFSNDAVNVDNITGVTNNWNTENVIDDNYRNVGTVYVNDHAGLGTSTATYNYVTKDGQQIGSGSRPIAQNKSIEIGLHPEGLSPQYEVVDPHQIINAGVRATVPVQKVTSERNDDIAWLSNNTPLLKVNVPNFQYNPNGASTGGGGNHPNKNGGKDNTIPNAKTRINFDSSEATSISNATKANSSASIENQAISNDINTINSASNDIANDSNSDSQAENDENSADGAEINAEAESIAASDVASLASEASANSEWIHNNSSNVANVLTSFATASADASKAFSWVQSNSASVSNLSNEWTIVNNQISKDSSALNSAINNKADSASLSKDYNTLSGDISKAETTANADINQLKANTAITISFVKNGQRYGKPITMTNGYVKANAKSDEGNNTYDVTNLLNLQTPEGQHVEGKYTIKLGTDNNGVATMTLNEPEGIEAPDISTGITSSSNYVVLEGNQAEYKGIITLNFGNNHEVAVHYDTGTSNSNALTGNTINLLKYATNEADDANIPSDYLTKNLINGINTTEYGFTNADYGATGLSNYKFTIQPSDATSQNGDNVHNDNFTLNFDLASNPLNPKNPNNPLNPDNPKNPVNPNNPNSPTNPSNPNAPTNPNNKHHSDSTNPNNPWNPSNSDSPYNPSNSDSPYNPNSPISPNHNGGNNTPTNPNSPLDPKNPNSPLNPNKPNSPLNPKNNTYEPSDPGNDPWNPNNPDSPLNPKNPVSPYNPNNPNSPLNPNSPQNEYNAKNGIATSIVNKFINNNYVGGYTVTTNEHNMTSGSTRTVTAPNVPGYKVNGNDSFTVTMNGNGSLSNGIHTFDYYVDSSQIAPINVIYRNQNNQLIDKTTGKLTSNSDDATTTISASDLAKLGAVGDYVDITSNMPTPIGYHFRNKDDIITQDGVHLNHIQLQQQQLLVSTANPLGIMKLTVTMPTSGNNQPRPMPNPKPNKPVIPQQPSDNTPVSPTTPTIPNSSSASNNNNIPASSNSINSLENNDTNLKSTENSLATSYNTAMNSLSDKVDSLEVAFSNCSSKCSKSTNKGNKHTTNITKKYNVNKLRINHSIYYHHTEITRLNNHKHYRWLRIVAPVLLHTSLRSVNHKKHYAKKLMPHRKFYARIRRIFSVKTKRHTFIRYEIRIKGKNYFLTGNKKFVRNSYIQPHQARKHHYIKVLHPVHEYNSRYFNRKTYIATIGRNERLSIKKVIYIGRKHYKQTRFVLNNGNYITANRNFVKLI